MTTSTSGPIRPPFWTAERLRRNWLIFIVTVVLCASVALGLSSLRAPVYTAETRLAVGNGQLTTLNIPGFPTASADMAANYARWIMTDGLDQLGLQAGSESVNASPLPESNVIRILATSTDPSRALKLADQAATRLQDEVNAVQEVNDPDALLKEVQGRAPALRRAQISLDNATKAYNDSMAIQPQGGPAVESRRVALEEADSKYTVLNLKQSALGDRYRQLVSQSSTEAMLERIGNGAQMKSNDRTSARQRYLLAGAGAGLLLGVLLTGLLGVAQQRPSRRRTIA